MNKNSLYLILAPFSVWVLNEMFVFKPEFFFISLGLGTLIIVFAVWATMKKRGLRNWPIFSLVPILFFLSFSLYSAIIASQFWIQIIFLLNAWFVFSYLKDIHYYIYSDLPESRTKLHRLLKSGSFLSTFALAATLYGLPIFLSWNFSLLLLFFIAASFILFGQFLIFVKDFNREQRIFLVINVLVLAEFAGILFFLPLSYNILGLLVALVFYLLVLFNDWRQENRLVFKNVKWPLAVASLITALILLSARWL